MIFQSKRLSVGGEGDFHGAGLMSALEGFGMNLHHVHPDLGASFGAPFRDVLANVGAGHALDRLGDHGFDVVGGDVSSMLDGVHNSVEAGVDTIEHGQYIAPDDIKAMVAKGIYYVPTLYVGEYVAEGRAKAGAKVWVDMVKVHAETFKRAHQAGVKIAFGTDVGGFDWKINPAVEFPLMVKYGMTPIEAIRSATAVAADLMGMSAQVGTVETGKFAESSPFPAIRWPT